MIWSNWRKAIWQGAGVAALFWAGLAWTQFPTPPSNAQGPERIMVVHENGRSLRCRVLQSWQLADGRIAHLLQAVDSDEMVTIVDEQAPQGDAPTRDSSAMPKRIYAWGVGRSTPPAGSPVPPVARPQTITPRAEPRQEAPAPVVNLIPEVSAPAVEPLVTNSGGENKSPRTNNTNTTINPIPTSNPVTTSIPIATNNPVTPNSPITMERDPLVIRIPEAPVARPTEKGPSVQVIDFQNYPGVPTPITTAGGVPVPSVVIIEPAQKTEPPPAQPMPSAGAKSATPVQTLPRPSEATARPATTNACPPSPTLADCGPRVACESPICSEPGPRAWRPGDALLGWLRREPPPARMETPRAPLSMLVDKKSVGPAERTAKAPYSTAMPQYDARKPSAVPLAIPKADAREQILVKSTGPEKQATPAVERKDRAQPTIIMPVDSTAVKPDVVKLPPAPLARTSDPLMTPEKLLPHDIKPKAPTLGHVPAVLPSEAAMLPNPAEMAPMRGWPAGTQSVAAAKSGMPGPLMYVPVPTVTVPQPIHPPLPPEPQLPEAPQLNAYLNAFSHPPAPKPPAPGPSSVPQWMQPHPAAVAQHQMMQHQQMQQQAYAHQQMQQHALMHQHMMQQQMAMAQMYGANPYVPAHAMMPSQGPMSNMARHYTGPMPPSPFGPAPIAPVSHVPMMPPHAYVQPAAYQPMPMQQPTPGMHIEELIKALQESLYPAQREMAAQSLMNFDWRAHPQIVPALLGAARQDPAASVRAGCVSCLGRMGASVGPVMSTLQSMRNDIDPRVRQEVDAALVRLGQATR